jgi:hypothetical protein
MMAANATRNYKDHVQILNGFLAKSDGKDKLTALIQYACMFLSAGEPGNIKKIQASVTAARKVFRVMRPLESIVPIINQPGFTGKQHVVLEAVGKIKAILMALYFGGDHFVWAHQIGIVPADKTAAERWQKISLYSWALGSVCTIFQETWQIVGLTVVRREGEAEEEYNKRVDAARDQIHQRLLVLLHGCVQAALACGLLQVLPFKPRTVGALGIIASAMNCYFLLPSYPKLAVKTKQV